MSKRGRPLGSTKKKRKGRPVGSKNKMANITPIIEVKMKCSRCGRHYKIRTDNLKIWTKEIKTKWICPICK